MVAGHLREQNGIYQIILSWKDSDGKRRNKQISTGLPIKGNKKRAETMLLKVRTEFDPENVVSNASMPFDRFLQKWLKDRATAMSPDSYAHHSYNVKNVIAPFYEKHSVSVKSMNASDLESFYEQERQKKNTPTKTLLHLHETLFTALAYAVDLGWRNDNLAENVNPCARNSQILFCTFLEKWLKMMKTTVKATTYSAYEQTIRKKVIPYFTEHHPGLRLTEVTAQQIQDYYTHEMLDNGLTANTVKHRHANIRKALQYAYVTDLIPNNPATKVELPKIEKYVGHYYNATQLDQAFKIFKGDPAEFGVITAAFYGLRRGEVVGLKWDAIDFEQKTITIRHTVTETTVDGKSRLILADSTKTKSSFRTLPLVEPFEQLLLKMKAEQEQNRKLCGSCYCKDYLDYIYVNEIGELVKPGYLTAHIPAVLEQNNMPRIRFHDLRHSCASLLFAQGVAMKDIQAWLGHSTIGTTANIYTHLDENSKINSANAILSILQK